MSQLSNKAAQIPKRVFALLVAMGLSSILALAFVTFWMTRTIDTMSSESVEALVAKSFESLQRVVSELSHDYADWQLAYDEIGARNETWVTENMAPLEEGSAYDRLLITQADGTPIFGYVAGGDASDLGAFEGVNLEAHQTQLAGTHPVDHAVISDYQVLDGVPATVTLTRIVPQNVQDYVSDSFPRLSMVRLHGPTDLAAIADGLGLASMQYVADPALASDARHSLRTLDGDWVAGVQWPGRALGAELFSRSLVVLIGVAALIAACAFAPSRTFSENTKRIASSAAIWMRRSSVVRIITSSVVLRVKNSGPLAMTQSAKYPPARAAAASDSSAGRLRASLAWARLR